jgi:hypothetical protein
MKTIKASDLGSYLYCRRAWWYQEQGYPSANTQALAEGTQHHTHHGTKVLTLSVLRLLGWLLLLAGIIAGLIRFFPNGLGL